MSRVCTLALPRPPCLFVFSWRCTTRPWTPVKVMLVYDRGLAPRPGLESPIGTQSPGEGSAPIGGTAVQQRDHGGAFKHINTLKMQHRYCFTHGQVLLQFVFKKKCMYKRSTSTCLNTHKQTWLLPTGHCSHCHCNCKLQCKFHCKFNTWRH